MSWRRYNISLLQVLDRMFSPHPSQTLFLCFCGSVGNVPVSAAQWDAWRRWLGDHESVPARSLSDPGPDSQACGGHAGRRAWPAKWAHFSTNAAPLHDPGVTTVTTHSNISNAEVHFYICHISLSERNCSPKNENFLKMYSPSSHPRCRWVS